MRLRQIALVARELEPVVTDLADVFDLGDPFRDPGVAEFGLHNAVFAVGDTFLEVVSPLRPDASAARFLERRGGDGGYMAIFQSGELAADRVRLSQLGVRIVWEVALDDIATIHLHPRDVGGAIVSLDEARPAASWRWAGPDWERRPASRRVDEIVAVEIAANDPERMARRWTSVLGATLPAARTADGGFEIGLDRGRVRVVDAHGRGEGIAAVGLATLDLESVRAAARERSLLDESGGVTIGGVRFELVVGG